MSEEPDAATVEGLAGVLRENGFRFKPALGELFRSLSWADVGSSAMMSRADAGIVRGRPVFLLPGSPSACRLAMERLVVPEASHLVGLLRR